MGVCIAGIILSFIFLWAAVELIKKKSYMWGIWSIFFFIYGEVLSIGIIVLKKF